LEASVELTDVEGSLGETVLKLFSSNYNCAQAVLLTMAKHWKLENKLLAKVSFAFGGGMGCGSVCGAVTGGIMAIGLKWGRSEASGKSMETGMLNFKLAAEFCKQFRKQNGSIICKDLIGLDLSDPVQFKKAYEENAYENCPSYVKSAVEILASLSSDKV
jgi:C_GCAxxG_C_C family probable redox protein